MTQVHVNRYVSCPFSAAVELAEQAVNRHTEFHLSPLPPFGECVYAVSAHTDDASDGTRKHDALLLAWRPHAAELFPDFRGVLTVRPKRSGVWLRLSGEYKPPFGAFGKVFDAIAGRTIARQTMKNFLAGLAGDIEAAYEDERIHAQ